MKLKISENFKKLIVNTGRKLYKQNLTIGTWGNISVLDPDTDLVYIKPSGINYNEIDLKDIMVIDKKGKIVEGFRKPSIEMPMHLSIYNARKDVKAIIHYHPIYSSVLAVTGFSLPGICEDFVQIVGEKVLCAKYALPGSEELAKNAVVSLGNRNAVFLLNHGTLCVGRDIKEAMKVCYVVEKTAHIYILSKNLGKCRVIPEEDIKVMQDFAKNSYGKQTEK
ncbi:MAG: class II aldolase [Candidatus Infernicultor aquiphilus]|uniref:Class II aldolase n=1 Tax=Candidatus Infernicultor aquiphilus TaxID=1805029 RepID=A0A1J5GPX8_9BACT|nr:class II aldolase/adducin family protein [bacterium]OIP74873.1 MAG: class II aldolase [Candidatus Atribacteria bacterium CG2_30_33_13]PIU25074.1 MAG: class II aldolase [Candidatus Atribacteria bacterium CG08_land_8_20_14_0_20_33_29]PIW11459.1 MAG: class II aldolase [Candidatus Atribacteria bacterium CG17_big_fil_post_rev_8_21_14_2_50_34_11]PIX34428.1 MAG: class II aldolase [Candidatus Atribacteria bacterium CG_4_8_14_3_um_filter_34_18]PIY33484.1 MAG: class II aldolase [Candidatus Atribacter